MDPLAQRTTRERLLDAAAEVMLEKGYQSARVQEIAGRAGLTTGAIYSTFDSKADLLAEAIRRWDADAFGVPAEAVKDGDGLVDIVVEALTGPPSPAERLVLEAWATALHDDGVRQSLLMEHERNRESLARRFELGTGDQTAEEWATVLHAMVVGSVVLRALDAPRPSPEQVRPVIEQVVELVTSDCREH